jgi:hypothetical protein
MTKFTFPLLLILLSSCSRPATELNTISQEPVFQQSLSNKSEEATPPSEPEYAGITIDQIFPITSHISAIDEDGVENERDLGAEGLTVRITRYVPVTLRRSGRSVLHFKRRSAGFWETGVGVSHLLGRERTELYVVASGPGAVCCTNYSIVDISSEKPRSVFHSEDFGTFRNPMEIFDADKDGVYELVQFDSCMRYFMDDCGSCSPEPRVVFKYDKRVRTYQPAPLLQQEFAAESMNQTEKWLKEKQDELVKNDDPVLRYELYRSALSYVVDLLHLGEEHKAWKSFKRYIDDEKVRRELKRRLSHCAYYNALEPKK